MTGAAVGPARTAGTAARCWRAGSVDVWCEQLVAGAGEDGDVHVICGTTLIVWAVDRRRQTRRALVGGHSVPGVSWSGGPATPAVCSSIGPAAVGRGGRLLAGGRRGAASGPRH